MIGEEPNLTILALTEEIKKVSVENQKLNLQLTKLESNEEKLKDELEDLNKDLALMQEKNTNYKSQNSSIRVVNTYLRGKKDQTLGENVVLREENEQLLKLNKDLKAKTSQQEMQTTGEIMGLKIVERILREKFTVAESTIASLKTENERLNVDLELGNKRNIVALNTAKDEVRRMKLVNDQLHEENAQYQEEIGQYRDENEWLQAEHDRLQDDSNRLHEQVQCEAPQRFQSGVDILA